MFVSARYVKFVEPTTNVTTTDTHVKAVDDQGREWQHRADCQVGDWQDYLASGGVIDPYVPDISESVTSAPPTLFGGPTMKEVFNG